MIRKINLIGILLFLSTTLTAQWSKGKGNGYYKISAWSLVANKHYTDTGDKAPNTTRGTFVLSFYGEYGLTDKIDIVSYIPFFTRTYQNERESSTRRGHILTEGEALNSIGDTDIGFKYSLLKNNLLAISSTLKFGIPLGKTSGGSEDALLQTGDGEFNQDLQIDIGTSFKILKIPTFGKIYFGYNNRTSGFSDELHYGGEMGLNFFNNKLWIIGKLAILKSTNNGSIDSTNSNGSIFANNIEYNNISFEAAYYITKKIGISYNYGTATSGRIISAAPSHSGGIFLDIK